MDIFKLMNWLNDNRKKILIFSHIVMAVTLINIVVAMFTGDLARYPTFFIWTFILQIIVFTITQINFKGND